MFGVSPGPLFEEDITIFNDSWTSARTDHQVRLSVVIAGTHHFATLMTSAHARQQNIDCEYSIRADDIDSLVRKGMRHAQSKRVPAVRLQLAGCRGRPQERILVVSGGAAPAPSQASESKAPVRSPVRALTQPASSAATDPNILSRKQAKRIAQLERKFIAFEAEQAKRLEEALRLVRLVQVQNGKLEESVETMAPMLRTLREQWRASQGHAPTAPGLPALSF